MSATVSGQILLADDSPDWGAVTFRPLVAAHDTTPDDRIVTTGPVSVRLDRDGRFTVTVVASNDGGWQLDEATMLAGGMPYLVTIAASGLRQSFTAYIPTGEWDLTDLVALDSPPEVAIRPGGGGGGEGGAVLSVNGEIGYVILNAADVGADAAGTAAAAVTAHEGAADPHAQYLTGTEGDARYATAAQGATADTALQDAPSDGSQYARQDGSWAVVAGGGGGSVDSVNGQSGAVVLDAADVGADPAGTASSAVTAHEAAADPHAGYQRESEKGAPNGYASLDGAGVIPTNQLPPLAVNDVFTVATEISMVGLDAQVGDMAIRTDTGRTYVLAASPASNLSNWREVLAAGQVSSVNGQTGVVNITAVGLGAEPLGAAATAVSNHESAADPHPQYLRPVEVVGGNNIAIDTASTPGSVIINAAGLLSAAMQQAEFIWEASPSTSPIQSSRVGVNDDDVSASTELYVYRIGSDSIDWSFIIGRMNIGWEIYAQSLNNATSWHRWNLTGAPTLTGDTWTIPVETIAGSPQGTEPNDNARILVGFVSPPITDHGVLDGREDDDHPQYLTQARHDALDHTGLTGITPVVPLTQSAFDALTPPDANTMYVVTGP